MRFAARTRFLSLISCVLLLSALPVLAQNTITVTPSGLTFNYQVGGQSPQPQQIAIFHGSSSTTFGVTWKADVGNWLSAAPISGSTPASFQVFVAPDNLQPGTYTGSVTITAANVSNSPQVVPVTLKVQTTPSITPVPSSVAFSYQLGAPTPQSRNVTIASSGAAFDFTTSVTPGTGGAWLTASPASGTTPATISLGVNATGLSQGTYTSTLVITAPGTTNTPLSVPVTLTVSANPTLTINPRGVVFHYQSGTAKPLPQTVLLSNLGAALTFNAAASVPSGTANWLSATPTNSQTPGAVVVTADPGTLPTGTYSGTVTITAPGAASPTETIPVTLVVSTGSLINLSSHNLTFNFQTGGNAPGTQAVAVSSTGGPVNYTAVATTTSGSNWLTVSPTTGSTPSNLIIGANTANLAAGIYTGNIAVTGTDAGSVTQNIGVTLNVSANPLLISDKSSLSFAFDKQGGSVPGTQTIALSSTGAAINYTVTPTLNSGAAGWLVVGPLAAATPSTLNVAVNPSGLLDGTYSAVISISAPGVDNSPLNIPVTLTVSNASALTISPGPLTFNVIEGTIAPVSQTIDLGSTGPVIPFNATATTIGNINWLIVTPTTGATPATLTVTVNPTGLRRGQYTGSIVITSGSASNSPQSVPITLNVNAAANMSVTPAAINVTYQVGSTNPAPQAITITSTGSVALNITAMANSAGNWLSISSTSALTPATLTATINPAGLAPGNYTGNILLSSQAAGNTPQTVAVSLTVVAAPPVAITAVTNSASNLPTAASPGLIVSIWGTAMGPANGVGLRLTPAGMVDTTLGEVRVLFDNIPAPLTYVSGVQINAVVPYEIAGRFSTRMEVEYQGRRSTPIELRVVDTAPGIYLLSAAGQGAIVNQNGTVNGASNPADRGSVAIIYATGGGQTTPPGVTGSVVRVPLPRLSNVTVRIGGQNAAVEYAGGAPGFVSGAIQLNVRVPEGIAPGAAVPVEVTIGSATSAAGVTMAVR